MKENILKAKTFLLLLFWIHSSGQKNPYNEVTISSPTAASLGKYADIPVNHHTGIPQIGVPIYTIKEGSLQLPISLSYHASGLKSAELASWVGAGWSLNAGGLITRTVQGVPDEKLTNSYTSNENGHLSDGGYNYYLFKFDGNSPLTTQDVAFFNDIAQSKADGEPDLFSLILAAIPENFISTMTGPLC